MLAVRVGTCLPATSYKQPLSSRVSSSLQCARFATSHPRKHRGRVCLQLTTQVSVYERQRMADINSVLWPFYSSSLNAGCKYGGRPSDIRK